MYYHLPHKAIRDSFIALSAFNIFSSSFSPEEEKLKLNVGTRNEFIVGCFVNSFNLSLSSEPNFSEKRLKEIGSSTYV